METRKIIGKRIKRITLAENTDVFDLEVEKNHTFFANGVVVHNCSETNLDQGGVCNLGSINLAAYVVNPFTSEAAINYTLLAHDIHLAVQFLDDVIDVEIARNNSINDTQRSSLINLRRLGLGVMGFADLLAMLGVIYGSTPSLALAHQLFAFMRDVAHSASIGLSRSRVPMLAWQMLSREEKTQVVHSGFYKTLPLSLRNKMLAFGIRNVSLLSIAPTGTISNLLGVTSGIEPLFMAKYTRRIRINGDDEFVDYTHPPVLQARAAGKSEILWPTAYDVAPLDHVTMQAVIQKYVDMSISKTVNLPSGSTKQDVYDVYMEGWKQGLKGMSVYVDGSRQEQVLYAQKEDETCPVCGAPLTHQSGCTECSECSWAKCSL